MKITRPLFSAASALAVFAAGSVPVSAYVNGVPPVATTTLRQRSEIRELYADSLDSILEIANMRRGVAEADMTGRASLGRSSSRTAQRNLNRHVLGYIRGVDYRVLNVSGDIRRRGSNVAMNNLPFSLVRTGGDDKSYGSWLFDRPTRRDIRENSMFSVNDRNRNVLKERADSLQ